jgi:hypothetical protein
MAVLVGLQTTPLNLSHSFIRRLHRRYYNRLLRTVPTLTVLTIALSRATPIPVLYRALGALDCRPISSARRLAAD